MLSGHIHPDFWPIARMLENQLGPAPRGGAAVCVYHHGEAVVDLWGGCKDEQGSPWTRDTMALSFSTTKGVASTALHILVDRGLLDYDDPVAQHWPEFGQNGKERITVRQVMCHEAGLYGVRKMIDHAQRMYDWEYMVDALARSKPAHGPGELNAYHGLTYGWLIGELVRRTGRKTISEFVQDEIGEPLQLDGFFIGAPPDEHARCAHLIQGKHMRRSPERLRPLARRVQPLLNLLRVPVDLKAFADALLPYGMAELDFSSKEMFSATIPAANGLFTARSLAKMYAALANGGELGGKRLLSEATLNRATEVQNRRIDRVVPFPMHWRLGYHRAMTTRGSSRRAFGHYGFGGSGAFADPSRNLAAAMVLNSGFGTPFGDIRTATMGGLALWCADRRERGRR